MQAQRSKSDILVLREQHDTFRFNLKLDYEFDDQLVGRSESGASEED